MASPWGYFDTSVLLKQYVQEEGSVRAQDLLRRYQFLSSAIAPVEAISAVCRRQARGDLTRRELQTIVSWIRRDRAHWELIEVTLRVLARAEEAIQEASLTTLDAIHVASVIMFQSDSGIRVPLITADSRQREGARRLGLDVIWLA